MSTSGEFVIFTDGGSRANPGPAAYAFVLKRSGEPDLEEKGYLGETTNNIAEYTGIIRALERALELGGRNVLLNSDSELIVNQMNGVYKVKHPNLQPLHKEAKELVRKFDKVTFRHIRREYNSHADRLCNEALDEAAMGLHRPPPRKPATSPKTEAPPAEDVLVDLLACLEKHAAAWARGNPKDPSPAEVCRELCQILKEAGVKIK